MNLFEVLEDTLRSNSHFVSEDGSLLKPRIQDEVTKLDPTFLRSLLQVPKLKEHFFTEVDGFTVFDQQKFMWIVNSKEFLPDSYTKYRNQIGLSYDDDTLLHSREKVALIWPFKDCILQGGQDEEDEKRGEIFYNEILAPDEVHRLLAPKAFTAGIRYDAEGKHPVTTFDPTDNLIIKGNNLFVLSSLLERYRSTVKCIYIDPPYNTGNDEFKYNDRFNHSTWLTFMRNRLQLAKKLLADDGVIFVQCDDNEQAYLKVLMDEVFEGGFLNCIAVKMSEASGVKMSHAAARLPKLKEYILLYRKGRSAPLNDIRVPKEQWDNEYSTIILNLDESELQTIKAVMDDENRTPEEIAAVQLLLDKAEYSSVATVLKEQRIDDPAKIQEFKLQNAYRIFQTASMGGGTTEAVNESRSKRKKNIFFAHVTPKRKMYVIKGDYSLEQRKPRIQVLFADRYLGTNPGDFWGDIKTTGLDNEGVEFKNGKKPEALIQRIISLATKPGDLILDFFVGSGTTAAVAHKMSRQYIAVEQMDYIQDRTLKRLRETVDGEQRGISKAVGWSGGGSFVYLELAEQGEALMSRLQNAQDSHEIQGVLDEATERGLLRPSVLPEEIQDGAMAFESLSTDEQKRVVAELIDKNRLYINASDVDEADLALDDASRAFTKSFYQMG